MCCKRSAKSCILCCSLSLTGATTASTEDWIMGKRRGRPEGKKGRGEGGRESTASSPLRLGGDLGLLLLFAIWLLKAAPSASSCGISGSRWHTFSNEILNCFQVTLLDVRGVAL